MTASQYPQSTAVGALNPMYDLADRATHLAARLLVSAKHGQNNQELAHGAKIARMMEDPLGKALTIALADQAFRSRDPARIADQLKHLIEQYGVPHYFAVWEQAGLMAAYVPQLIVPRVAARLRHETQDVILPPKSTSCGPICASAIAPAPVSTSTSWEKPSLANTRPSTAYAHISLC